MRFEQLKLALDFEARLKEQDAINNIIDNTN